MEDNTNTVDKMIAAYNNEVARINGDINDLHTEIANRNITIDNLRAELVKRDERIDDLITQAATTTQIMYQTKADLRAALKHARTLAVRLAEADGEYLLEHDIERAVEELIGFGMTPLKRIFEGELEITVTVPFRVELPLSAAYDDDSMREYIVENAALCDMSVEPIDIHGPDGFTVEFDEASAYTDASAWVTESN
jgi:hypothetical protein